MKDIESDINALKRNPNGVRFAELSKILDRWFGTPPGERKPPRL